MSDTKTSKAQNLARIRDNQRRSRARRKEYLQEIEAKLRQCEQLGVEASAEIQSAARKVLEENRRLRAMLRTRGVPEAEIIAALGHDKPFESASAAPALMSALQRKRTAGSGPSLNESPPNLHANPPLAPQVPTAALAPISIPHQPALATSSIETQSPLSVADNDSPPPFTSAPYYPMEMAPLPQIKTEQVQHLNYSFDANTNNPWLFPTDQTYVPETMGYYNTTSCIDAANIIRTMRTDVGTELEVDLGCHSPDQECRVPNPLIFNVMDKYSHPGLRM